MIPTMAVPQGARGGIAWRWRSSHVHTAYTTLLLAVGTAVQGQGLSAQLLYDAAVPVAYRSGAPDGHPLGQSVGIGLAMHIQERSIGLRVEREFFHYTRTSEAPPYANAYSEEVRYQLDRITLFGAAELGGSRNIRWEVLGGFGVSWVAAQSVSGVRAYANGTEQELVLGSDATQAAYSLLFGLGCTHQFNDHIGLRAELVPVYRIGHEWVEEPRGNGSKFTSPLVPDPVLLIKVGVGLVVRFGASEG